MSTTWYKIAPEEAARHPLYGIKNWLLVFTFGPVLGLLIITATLSGEARKMGMTVTQLLSVDHPAISLVKLELGLHFILAAFIYWALIRKHPKFRVIAISAMLASWPLGAFFSFMLKFEGGLEAVALQFFPWAFSCTVWVTYLQRSKRVRVTFEHCIMESSHLNTLHNAVDTNSTTEILNESLERRITTTSITPPTKNISANQLGATILLPNSSATDADELLWEIALSEFEGNGRRTGLYAKAFSDSNGDEALTKSSYLRHRVDQLTAERSKQERAVKEAREVAQREATSQIEDLKIKFVSGTQLNAAEIKALARHALVDQTLPSLREKRRGETLLHWCSRYSLQDEAKLLIEQGANVDDMNLAGYKPSALAPDRNLRKFLKSASYDA